MSRTRRAGGRTPRSRVSSGSRPGRRAAWLGLACMMPALLGAPASAQPARDVTTDPDRVRLEVEDVRRFARVMRSIAGGVADTAAARILLLGTFHFDDPGLDDYVPQFPWDPFTDEHRREIDEVVRRLARYRPTRIALEWPAARQARLDSLYDAWLADRITLGANERQQLGFRLARRLGHSRVYAVDAPARSYFPDMTQEEYERREARLMEGADPALVARHRELEARYEAMHRMDDSLKVTMPLRDYLVRENEPARVRHGHGQYLIGGFRLGRGDDYLGPDMRTRWYNRNLRIFHNLQRITSGPDERILVIIGSGHLPILRHAVESSPEYRLVEVRDYLAR